jgi:hypothetical protein
VLPFLILSFTMSWSLARNRMQGGMREF